jgi:hypothetical protein
MPRFEVSTVGSSVVRSYTFNGITIVFRLAAVEVLMPAFHVASAIKVASVKVVPFSVTPIPATLASSFWQLPKPLKYGVSQLIIFRF